MSRLLVLFMFCFFVPVVHYAQTGDSCAVTAPSSLRLHHDEFRVTFNCPVDSFAIKIYDRWGNEIYHSDSSNVLWTGKCNEKYCEAGQYVWVATSYMRDRKKQYRGTVMLYVM